MAQAKRRVGVRVHGVRAEKAPAPRNLPAVLKDGPSDPSFYQSVRLQLAGDQLTMPYAQHAWVYAAISAIASNIAGVPFEFRTGSRTDPRPVESSPWTALFDAPNPMMSRFQLWEATMIYLSHARGEAMWVLEGKGDAPRREGEVPAEIWVHPGDHFKPVVRNQVIERWIYNEPRTGKQTILDRAQVIQFKYWNPYDPLRGLGPLAAAMAAVRQDFKASQFNEAFFDNGADIGGMLISEKRLMPEAETQLRTQFEERHQGPKKRGKIAVLSGGLKYEPNPQTHADMQFLEQRKWSREEIMAVFKVPKSELSLYEDVNYATALSQARGFWEKTLIPKMRYLEDVLWQRLFKDTLGGREWGMFDLGVVEALQAGFGEKVTTAKMLFDMGYPVNVINDRLQLGLERIEWGDEALVNGLLVPASSLVSGGGEGAPATGEDQPVPPEDAPTTEEPKAIGKAKRDQDPAKVAYWRGYIEKVFTPREKEFMVKLRVYFGAQRRDVLGRLERVAAKGFAGGVTKDITAEQVEQILFVEEEWNKKLRETLRPTYRKTAQASLAQVQAELGAANKLDALDPNLLRFLREKEIKVTEINATTREKLRQSIFEGLKEKETVNGIQDRIKGVYNLAAGDSRRLTIARTETGQVLSEVRFMAFEEAGIEKQEWRTAGDENVRESHAAQDGQVVKVGDEFKNGLTHPSEVGGPAAEVINCRCTAVAVPKETPVS